MASKVPAYELSHPETDALNAAAVISVQDIVHRYDDRAALNGVSFQVRPAELFGLLGPNGSGKTTLFRILSTLMLPTGGRAVIAGNDPAKDPDGVRRQIGVVFQARSIDLKLSAYENLRHQGHLYGLHGPALRSRIKEMLSRVALGDRANDRAETFSGGMQRRLELAKGLLHHPSVLLLDEPTTGLDPRSKLDVQEFVEEVRDTHDTTIVLTTHDLADIQRLCRRLVVIDHGRVVHDGSLESLHARYGSRRRLVVDLDEPLATPVALAGVTVESVQADGRRITYALDGTATTGELVRRLAEVAALRDITVLEPDIEDVVARLYTRRAGHKP